MRTHAFVFARGGSKGLPGKNIRKLAGKPLLQYSIEVAQATSLIDKVFVSTDDEEIATVAEKFGAIVIERPTAMAQDDSPEWLAWRHAIEWVASEYGDFDCFVSLPATSPLRSLEDIEAALLKFQNSKADVCIAITPANRSPYFNMVKHDEKGNLELVMKSQDEITRRQDAPPVFDITTVVYACKPTFVLKNYGLFSGNIVSIEIPKCRAVDIDDIYDFKLAEAIVRENN